MHDVDVGVVFEAEGEFLLPHLKYTVIQYSHYIGWFDYSFVHDNIGHCTTSKRNMDIEDIGVGKLC